MNDKEQHWDDQRLEKMFSLLNHDVTPPDATLLDKLRSESTGVFEAQFSDSATTPKRGRKQMIIASRLLAAAAAIVLVSWLVTYQADDERPTLQVAIVNLSQTDSFHLQMVRDESTTNVWGRKPHHVRWEMVDGTYRIDDGEKLWEIDEKENRAVALPSLMSDKELGIDLSRFFGVLTPQDYRQLVKERPAGQIESEGELCDVYRWSRDAEDGELRVEALVGAKTATLRSLEAVVVRGTNKELVGRLVVEATNFDVDEALFQIADTLTVDGRIGKVLDVQGLVGVKPLNHSRWTPVDAGTILKPGDWVRANLRGANAITLRLVRQKRVTLGPGTLVELLSPNKLRLISGELKVVTDPDSPLQIVGPDQQQQEVAGTRSIRLADRRLVKLEKEPAWIAGFEGATTQEAVGSLVAKIDGRDVPLTVGYHKVTVDIRDQIARTVIEESFVNHTKTQLEGIFYFPLPQDASIAGFGMWIGDELVEADIVEKQRAREIYETILREKRDPGLLEWTGGNLFKARIFPIPGRSEKRIKISYTQVLPRKGDRYRYAYSLQSELLKQHPLSELAITVNISSQMPLAEVSSPTHGAARISRTKNAARIEFTAQEYTPDRDFEVAVRTAGKASDALLIPHQRGEDGYFMLQLMPLEFGESADSNLATGRSLLADGDPLDVLVIADTSASIREDARNAQADFMSAILSSLAPSDTFNVVMSDVECHWLFDEPVPADAENIEAAADALNERMSLGWTDLDKTFSEVLKRVGKRTQVVYLGDGVVTNGDADPVAFNNRLRRLYAGHTATLHAVAISSSYEPLVMKTIASLGGGSFRSIEAGQVAVKTARELLGEMTQPVTRITDVKFTGLQTARLYPEQLPNLASGTQQILLGRYLPVAGDIEGEITLTLARGEDILEKRFPFKIEDTEAGNSFVPRLWARMHLDALLEQGSSQTIQNEVIALSEEYHIITPYTSLLVLESDADRERFKVKRRFQMRDGERFFAESREQINYELLQQQMRKAGDWRIRLRMEVLRELASLGRVSNTRRAIMRGRGLVANQPMDWGGTMIDGNGRLGARQNVLEYAGQVGLNAVWGPGGDQTLRFDSGYGRSGDKLARDDALGGDLGWEVDDLKKLSVFDDYDAVIKNRLPLNEAAKQDVNTLRSAERYLQPTDLFATDEQLAMSGYGGEVYLWDAEPMALKSQPISGGVRGVAYGAFESDGEYKPRPAQWWNQLFPNLPAPPTRPRESGAESSWSAEARNLAELLLRKTLILSPVHPVEINRQVTYYEPRWQEATSRQHATYLLAQGSWLQRSGGNGGQTLVQFCDQQHRSIYSVAYLLGRVRAANPEDLAQPPLDLSGHVLRALTEVYANYEPRVEPAGDGRSRLVLTSSDQRELRFLIDTEKAVLLRMESLAKGKVNSRQEFRNFVQVLDAWFATKVETFDGQGRRTVSVSQEFTELDEAQVNDRLAEMQSERPLVQAVQDPLPRIIEARHHIEDGKARFEDHLVLLVHYEGIQRWERVLQELELMEALAADKPGMQWLRNAILNVSRRRDILRKRILHQAAELVESTGSTAPSQELFLANHLTRQAAGIFETNEVLRLLDILRPVYERQPSPPAALKQWHQYQVSHLHNAGRRTESLAIQKQLAIEYPHDASMQQMYASALIGLKEYEAGIAWIGRVLTPEAQWNTHENESLRQVVSNHYERSGRYKDLVEYLEDWSATNPEGQACYREYLTALIKSDQIEKADELMATWLDVSQWPQDPPQHLVSRAQVAVQQTCGQGYHLQTNRIDEKWLDPLADVVIAYVKQEVDADGLGAVANNVMSQYRFTSTDQCRRVRRVVAQRLQETLVTMSHNRVNRLMNWVLSNDPALDPEQWRKLADVLIARWDAEQNVDRKHAWGSIVARVLSRRIGADAHLAFLRRQVSEGPRNRRSSYVSTLFETLIQQPWSQSFEDEAASLISDLSDAEEPQARLAVQVAALQRLTDTMVRGRYTKLMGEVKEPSRLTRTELQEAQAERRKRAMSDYATRLDHWRRSASELLAPWIDAEWCYLQVQLGEGLAQVVERCWEFLTDEPKLLDPQPADALQVALMRRALLTLGNLAARRDPPAGLAERLARYTDKAIDRSTNSAPWKRFQYRMRIALDETEGLVDLLETWIDEKDRSALQWRVAQAYLLAEQGRVQEAIKRMVPLRDQDTLGPNELEALEAWLLVLDRRADYIATRRMRMELSDESTLRKWIDNQLRLMNGETVYGRWVNPFRAAAGVSTVPGEMDENVPLVFGVLFAKSSNPHYYLVQLEQYYRATHDFQLLTGVAESVVGHTAGRVYPFLMRVGRVLDDVREEATCDELVARLEKVRERAKTDVDRRALDLLELLVERRCAELLNQPGPHADKALAAIQRSFKREWTTGESRLVADLLANLGQIADESLAQEQLQQLKALHAGEEAGTADRLHIAGRLAQALWNYSKHDNAIDLLEAALDERQAASGGVLPANANDELSQYISHLRGRGLYMRGERVLLGQLEHPVNAQQKLWLKERLYELYNGALRDNGEVSLGKDVELYREATRRLQAELDHADSNFRRQLIKVLLRIYTTASEKKIGAAPADLVAFARDRLPRVLQRHINDYHSICGDVANTINRIAGSREALAMLIRTIESEPRWLALSYSDGWNQHGWRLGQWREKVKALGDLEEPLLRIVTKELRSELESRNSRNRVMYWRHYSHFWTEKVPAFRRTAETVYAQRKGSSESVVYIAQYLADGLGHYPRAIEMLAAAHEAGILSESGQSNLVNYLHHEKRFEESIALLEPLVELRPDSMHHRTRLMHAYFRTGRRRQLLAQLRQTDKYFHEGNRWVENNISQLAHSCLQNELFEESAEYFTELIPMHKRSAPNRGVGNGTLSSYCQQLARAYAGMGKTAEAVDAACEAVVAWGPRIEQRRSALYTLEKVLRDADDLGQYVSQLDRDSAEQGLDKPIVRKALGLVYFAKREYSAAAEQFRQAVALQPNDSASHEKLIECFDKLKDQQGAIAQSLELLQLKPREIESYKSLGRRFENLGDADGVERTYTSIVESLPNESEGHSMLAEIREEQGRWGDAAVHWEQVARIRSLEPTGLLRLAAVQIRLKQWAKAKETLAKLRSRSWPSRFGSVDSKVRNLERRLD